MTGEQYCYTVQVPYSLLGPHTPGFVDQSLISFSFSLLSVISILFLPNPFLASRVESRLLAR